MKRKDLEDLGLEKEVIDKVMGFNGADVEAEKAKTKATESERDKVQEQLTTATEALEQFKDVNPDELNATIAKLQDDLKAKDTEYQAKEADRLFAETIKSAIKEAGGKNEKAIMALIDVASLKESKNQTEDIKKALDSTKESDAYLFGANEPINNPVGGLGNTGGEDTQTATVRAIMGLPPESK